MSSGSCRSTESSPSRTNDDGASLRASFPPKLSALASRVTPDQGQDGAPGFDLLALSCSGSEFHVGSESRRAISASVPRSPGPPSLSCAPSGSSSQKSCPHGWASIPRGASSPGALKCPWPPEWASASEALRKQPSLPDPSMQSPRPPPAPPCRGLRQLSTARALVERKVRAGSWQWAPWRHKATHGVDGTFGSSSRFHRGGKKLRSGEGQRCPQDGLPGSGRTEASVPTPTCPSLASEQ